MTPEAQTQKRFGARTAQTGKQEPMKKPFDFKTVIEAKQALATELRNKYATEAALGWTWSDSLKRGEYIQLNKEIKDLRLKLSQLG